MTAQTFYSNKKSLFIVFYVSFTPNKRHYQFASFISNIDTEIRYVIKGCKPINGPGRVAQSVGHPTHKSGVLGLIPGLATYFRFSFRFFKKGSCQLLAKVCA